MSIVSRMSSSRAAAIASDIREQVAHLIDLREPLEDRDEAADAPVCAVSRLDDVVVEIFRSVARRYREQLAARGVHEHPAQPTDFGRYVDGHGARS